MARIVLGVGTAHGPQATVGPEMWHLRAAADRQNPKHWFRGKSYDFSQLVTLRQGEAFHGLLTEDAKQVHFRRCRSALEQLARIWDEVRPDVAVLFGNDQFEVFGDTGSPVFAVYRGTKIPNIPKTPEAVANLPPGIAPAEISYCPPKGAEYPGRQDLADHIIHSLVADRFDVAQYQEFPVGGRGSRSVPHAYGFVYRCVMGDRPVPSVPLIINTHYPPNRPSARRCIEFGRSVARAVISWPEEVSVALVASGGLTHYVIDEEFDRFLLEEMGNRDLEKLASIEEAMFESEGTAEAKNWLPVAGAMVEAKLEMAIVDYVPCYRSEAGTGNAMGFAYGC